MEPATGMPLSLSGSPPSPKEPVVGGRGRVGGRVSGRVGGRGRGRWPVRGRGRCVAVAVAVAGGVDVAGVGVGGRVGGRLSSRWPWPVVE